MTLFENYIQALAKKLHAARAERDNIVDELRQHMAESRQAFVDEGYSESEAERLTIEKLGDPAEICQKFDAIYKSSPFQFIIDLFHKENTAMRRTILETVEWSSLVLIVVVTLAVGNLCAIAVLPRIDKIYRDLGITGPDFTLQYADFSRYSYSSLVIVLLLIIAIYILVLKRWQPVLKAQMLKTGLSVLSLVLVAWVAISTWAMAYSFSRVVTDLQITEKHE
jgi:hypothetical protein